MAEPEVEPSSEGFTKGRRVIVLTSMGWLQGTVYEVLSNGRVRVEIKKVKRGRRRLLPTEAKVIWPHSARYGVAVKQDATCLRPSPFKDGLT
jgi:hypothetical protein